jgi:LysM repeat protein
MIFRLYGYVLTIVLSVGLVGSGQRTESGVWHTVEAGQTLSEIAKAYNISINVIVRANNVKNPDSVRAGTRLFIPDSAP